MEDEHKSEFYISPRNSRRSLSEEAGHQSSLSGCLSPDSSQRRQQVQQQTDDDYSYSNSNNNNGWATHWEDTLETSSVNSFDLMLVDTVVDSLPPQLHPAVSLGMKRVSSCAFFSLQGSVSEADLQSLSVVDHHHHPSSLSLFAMANSSNNNNMDEQQHETQMQRVDADWLYHDILMTVFTFLDAPSLAAFSETARRCNFECFYFLQLQLQRAAVPSLLRLHGNAQQQPQDDPLAAIAGSWSMSRLASLDKQEAEAVVQEYLDSNSTLRIMPLSHSLAYIRQVLRRHGFPTGASSSSSSSSTQGGNGNNNTLAATTLVIGLVGAATVMSGNVNVEVVESFGTELPNMLFKVGFVGSLMGAARHRWEGGGGAVHDDAQQQPSSAITMRETAEQMARTMHSTMRGTAEQMARTMQQVRNMNHDDQPMQQQDDPSLLQQQRQAQEASISRRMYEAFLTASGRPSTPEGRLDGDNANSIVQGSTNAQQQAQQGPNPYEHLPNVTQQPRAGEPKVVDDNQLPTKSTTGSGDVDATGNRTQSDTEHADGKEIASISVASATAAISSSIKAPEEKMPSGCVGAYFRAIQRASNSITRIVQNQRRARFEALPDKDLLARTFIDSCCSDDTLEVVKDLVQQRGVIDAEGFHVGSDGTETCALHASSFHGATKVLEFLCGGIDERDASKDEGLCCVDIQDVNGWTALHFAAGANCVESARILADRGAKLSITAENGYTPLQWALRLCNHEVAEELRKRLEQTDPYHNSNSRWIAGASQPLSMIAHHFFALIPTQ